MQSPLEVCLYPAHDYSLRGVFAGRVERALHRPFMVYGGAPEPGRNVTV